LSGRISTSRNAKRAISLTLPDLILPATIAASQNKTASTRIQITRAVISTTPGSLGQL
jgi:hypothetical protein